MIWLFSVQAISAENLIQDTLFVSFSEQNDISFLNSLIDTVIDARKLDPHYLGNYEINKYWIIPVDLLIYTEHPLSENFKNIAGQLKSKSTEKLKIVIEKFWLSKMTNSLIYPHYRIDASVQLYDMSSQLQPAMKGQLLYEVIYREPLFKDDLKEGFESVIRIWENDFADDLEKVTQDSFSSSDPNMTNFRKELKEIKWINLMAGIDYIFSYHERFIDGELLFSHRESRSVLFRSGYGLRYRRSEKFESIEFGSSVDYLFYRFNNNFQMQFKSQILIGVNRWKDYKTYDHKFYDAIILDFAFNQKVTFNPLDRNSLLVGFGLSEDMSYIYSRGFNIQFGFLISLGLKL